MSELQEYKCPCCGGAIAFDVSLQKMKCPYCDTEFDIDTLCAYDDVLKNESEDDMNWQTASEGFWQDGETDGLHSYVCNSCGGEIVGDETLAATICPFCNNPVVMTEMFSGMLKPDLVIPFKLDKKAAKDALKNHYKKKKLLPKIFKDENHLDEIQGVYVPFWLFNTDATANIRYKATRVRFWSDSNYKYTKTDYYAVTRSGSLGFNNVPVDGSTKMDDALMESIEPFNFSEAVDFRTAYLAGYLADKYDVCADDSIGRANQRIKQSTEAVFANTVIGYNTVICEHSSVHFKCGSTKYALLPVWILNTSWNGQKYTFAMNGQTGKMVGDLPLDKSAYVKWLFGLTGIFSAATFLFLWITSLL